MFNLGFDFSKFSFSRNIIFYLVKKRREKEKLEERIV